MMVALNSGWELSVQDFVVICAELQVYRTTSNVIWLSIKANAHKANRVCLQLCHSFDTENRYTSRSFEMRKSISLTAVHVLLSPNASKCHRKMNSELPNVAAQARLAMIRNAEAAYEKWIYSVFERLCRNDVDDFGKKNMKTKRQYGEMRSLTRSVETLRLPRLTFLSIYDNLFFSTTTLLPIVHWKAFERVSASNVSRRVRIFLWFRIKFNGHVKQRRNVDFSNARIYIICP